jgi:F420-dependent oxidoreductase-like protein
VKVGVTIPYTAQLGKPASMALVKAADELGYETVWVAEQLGWDAFSLLTHFAAATSRIKLGTAIVNVFGRTPAMLAQSAATVDALSGGRLVLGLGTSGPAVIQGWHGLPYRQSLRRMREVVDILRLLLRREPFLYHGQVFQQDEGLRIGMVPVRDRIPIYLATLTPAGMELAGELGDGWLPIFFSPRHFDTVMRPHLEAGAARAGRSLSDLAICVGQNVVVTSDREAGRDSVRPYLAMYLGGMGSRERNYYNRLFRRYGFVEEAERIQELVLAGRSDEAAEAVTDEMVDLVNIVGTAEECRERLDELEAMGVNEVTLRITLPEDDPAEMVGVLEALAP